MPNCEICNAQMIKELALTADFALWIECRNLHVAGILFLCGNDVRITHTTKENVGFALTERGIEAEAGASRRRLCQVESDQRRF